MSGEDQDDYAVSWDVEVAAGSPVAAAELALEMQRDPDSSATVFSVTPSKSGEAVAVDLSEEWETGRADPPPDPVLLSLSMVPSLVSFSGLRSHSVLSVLAFLAVRGPSQVSEINMGVYGSRVYPSTEILDCLSGEGLIEVSVDPSCRRRKIARITVAGALKCAEISRAVRDRIRDPESELAHRLPGG